jgi:BirA family transcriptional regulator, biotin operon repressor / biotin---[acetyl-CoA-carboxylase] ligase
MSIGSKYIFRENLPSTNSYAVKLLKNDKIEEGAIIYTNFQSEGKGHAGNIWESEAGKNLLFSLILYPSFLKPTDQFIISKIISLGICDFLRPYTSKVSIKWPNDIYVNNDKIAGILIEAALIRNEIEYLIAGIGLNLNQKIFSSDAPNPVSLSLITGKEYSPVECLKNLVQHIDKRYNDFLERRRRLIDSDYINNLYRFDQWCEFSDSNGSYEGKIIAIDHSGRLRIEDHRGRTYEYGFKEVTFR